MFKYICILNTIIDMDFKGEIKPVHECIDCSKRLLSAMNQSMKAKVIETIYVHLPSGLFFYLHP